MRPLFFRRKSRRLEQRALMSAHSAATDLELARQAWEQRWKTGGAAAHQLGDMAQMKAMKAAALSAKAAKKKPILPAIFARIRKRFSRKL